MHTSGPWKWTIWDNSMATLGVGDNPGLGDPHVLSLGPCKGCAERRTQWEWGACRTPKLDDALLIAAAPELLAALKYARRFLREADHDVAFVDAAIKKAEEV